MRKQKRTGKKPHLILMKGTDLVNAKGQVNEEALDAFVAAIDRSFGIASEEHSPGGRPQTTREPPEREE